MSDAQSDISKSPNKIHKLPLIIKKRAIKSASNFGMLFRRVPGASGSVNLIKEHVIYKAQGGDFLKGKYPDLCIINEVNVVKNSNRTTAAYTANGTVYGTVVNLASDAVVKTIGQENYDKVFTALCSVINQELKVEAILALLSERPPPEAKETQTYESSFTHLLKWKQRIRHNKRKKIGSYAVEHTPHTDSENAESKKLETVLKKVVVDPAEFLKLQNVKAEPEDNNVQTESMNKSIELSTNNAEANDTSKDIKPDLRDISIVSVDKLLSDRKQTNISNDDLFPELREIVDEDSNISEVGSLSNLSIGSCFSLTNIESKTKSLLNDIEAHTELDDHCHNESFNIIECVDGSMIRVKGNPDPFHIATPEILKDLSQMDQKKILLHQAYLDWKFCLQRNEDNNLPIHLAVLDNDVGLLKRQCLVLKSRHESVDIPAAGNLTALQMAIFQDCPECTAVLLAQGADLLVKDDEARTPLHLAAEIGAQHVDAILEHCRNNARQILKESDTLWKPELRNKSDADLVDYLLTRLNTICDNQGYTPLMLASKLGHDCAVALLAGAAPSAVNTPMPSCGNTALYIAAGAACTEAARYTPLMLASKLGAARAVALLAGAAPSAVNTPMPSCGNTALYIAAGAACTEAANRGDKTTIPENYKRVVECLLEHGADPSIENNSGSNVHNLLTDMSDATLSCIIAVKLSTVNGCGSRVGDYMLVKEDNGALTVASTKSKKDVSNELVVCQPKKVYNAKTNKIITETVTGSKNAKRETKAEVLGGKNTKQQSKVVNTSAISTSSSNSSIKARQAHNERNHQSFLSEINKPVILKNVPVITKIVSFDSQKPVLVKSITAKKQYGKGLQTPITAKTCTKVQSSNEDPPLVPPLVSLGTSVGSNTPQYLKILPKTASKSVEAGVMSVRSAGKRPAESPGPSSSSVESGKDKFCKILPEPDLEIKSESMKAQSAAKRPERESDNSGPSPIKKFKK